MRAGTILRSALAGALGLALIIGLFLFIGMPFKQFAALIVRIKFLPFAGIVVCSFLYVILGAAKWHLIAGVKPPRALFYTHYTAQAMLIGQFLPPPVAIAANRATVMKFKQGVALKKGILNALYDMGFDFMVAALLIPASLLQWAYRFNFGIWLLLGIFLLCSGAFLLAHAPKILPASWRVKLGIEDTQHHLLSQRLIGLMMLLSAARLGLVILRLALGAATFAISVPFETVAYVVPPATMSALLVLTPANLGIAEWSSTYLFALWGIPAVIGAFYGVSFRILVFFSQLIVSAICWLLYRFGN